MATYIGNWQRELEHCLDKVKLHGGLENFKQLSTDETRVQFIRQKGVIRSINWISCYFENCNQLHLKSQEKASQFRKEGNLCFKKKLYKEAAQSYTKTILFAPPDSEELPLGYSNNSAALFHLGDYEASLRDIELAVSAGFPGSSRYKLAIRKATCLHRLGQSAEAESALEEAEEWLDQADITAARKESLIQELLNLRKSSEKDTSGAEGAGKYVEEDGKLPRPSHGTSATLVQASRAVELRWNREQGRYLVANRDIQAGDTLIVEKPFAAVLLPEHYPTHCNNCFQQLKNTVPCRRCTQVRYCSLTCRDEAWQTFHHIECAYSDLLHSVGIAHLSLRVILVAGLDFLTDFMKGQECGNPGGGEMAGLDADGKYRRSYQTVYDLMTHSEDMCPEDLFQYSLTAALLLGILQHSGWFPQGKKNCSHIEIQANVSHNATCTTCSASANQVECNKVQKSDCVTEEHIKRLSVGEKQTENQSTSPEAVVGSVADEHVQSLSLEGETLKPSAECIETESCDLIGGLLLRHIQQLVCNAHAITKLQVTSAIEGSVVEESSQVRVATAIYPTASLMNHSCDPTIISSFQKDTLVVKAVKTMRKGDEIFNCYGPHYKRMTWAERQETLKQQYFFTCQCPPCLSGQEEEKRHSALTCSDCSGPALETGGHTYRCGDCGRSSQYLSELQQAQNADDIFQTGVQLLNQGQFDAALCQVQSAYNMGRRVMYKYSRKLAEMEDCIARCYASTGQFKKAAEYLRKSITIVEEIFGARSIEVANELQKLAEVLVSAQQWADALEVTHTAIDIFTMHYGRSHDTVVELTNLKSELEAVIESMN